MKSILIGALLVMVAWTNLHAAPKKIVGYYANWSMYSADRPLLTRDLPIGLITDVNYAFMKVDGAGTISLSDPWADIQSHTNWQHPDQYPYWGNLQMLRQLKIRAREAGHPIRTFFSVGGWGEFSRPFSQFTATAATRAHFVAQAIAFCETYDFDGIDIDWEYPVGPQEAEQFVLLLEDLQAAFKAHTPELFVTAAVPAGYQNYEQIDWCRAGRALDTVHLMTYDYAGSWDGFTGHQAPLEQARLGDPRYNTRSTVKDYLQWIPAEKLTVGIPLYYRTYANARDGDTERHYGSSFNGPGNPPMLQYRQVMASEAQFFWDDSAHACSAYWPSSGQYGTGINLRAIREICQFIEEQKLGGAMVWELNGDTASWEAMSVIAKGS